MTRVDLRPSDSIYIREIGLELTPTIPQEMDADAAWSGATSNGSGPGIVIRVERVMDPGMHLCGDVQCDKPSCIVAPPGYIYEALISMRSVRVRGSYHRSVLDAWEEARENAHEMCPPLAAELRLLAYAQMRREDAERRAYAEEDLPI